MFHISLSQLSNIALDSGWHRRCSENYKKMKKLPSEEREKLKKEIEEFFEGDHKKDDRVVNKAASVKKVVNELIKKVCHVITLICIVADSVAPVSRILREARHILLWICPNLWGAPGDGSEADDVLWSRSANGRVPERRFPTKRPSSL